MLITRKSILSGRERTYDIDVTQDQIDRWLGGELIQNAMPHLSPEAREFLKTGIVDVEWQAMTLHTEEDEGGWDWSDSGIEE